VGGLGGGVVGQMWAFLGCVVCLIGTHKHTQSTALPALPACTHGCGHAPDRALAARCDGKQAGGLGLWVVWWGGVSVGRARGAVLGCMVGLKAHKIHSEVHSAL
jgi:hypothetical protein